MRGRSIVRISVLGVVIAAAALAGCAPTMYTIHYFPLEDRLMSVQVDRPLTADVLRNTFGEPQSVFPRPSGAQWNYIWTSTPLMGGPMWTVVRITLDADGLVVDWELYQHEVRDPSETPL
jgi:hypothetical protein